MIGPPAAAQKTIFQTYRCGDGTEFIVGFFQYDKRAHMQVDGKSVTLQKRIALTGARYSGGGRDADGQEVGDDAEGRQTAGDDLPIVMKKGRNLVVSTLLYLVLRA